ncbi:TonB-dependent receptor [Dyadobacter arcticus]|uniref:Outer membrane receptor protein involved in Fe transport n=1 Tax=Dyadobacter arcticus TaxID=1078754 RepID=A0ABX0UV29_9BACT|nr:TonB-dependent receptor [Dyadobacter arcticus]NIJ54786.1 outer membrane receptor protein involved in Fe transport [Dyadobacter arcticus]
MKLTYISLILGLLTQHAFSQITGKLKTANGQPVLYANVLLLNPADSSLVKGAVTNESGSFQMGSVAAGNYFLRISAVGYKTTDLPAFLLAENDAKLAFGDQIIAEDVQEMGELVVKAQKPLYQQEIDRTVVNVESSLMTKGSSTLQVLERSPGVFVDMRNGNIALNGKSSVLVMLNGKLMRLPMSQVMAMLSGMSANDIEKIEIMTTPPSKYDAEGSAGMINIVLKKREDLGTTGSMSATAGYGWAEKGTGSMNVSHNTAKLNMYASYSFVRDHFKDGWSAKGGQDMPLFGGKLYVEAGSTQVAISNSHNATAGLATSFGKTTLGANLTYSTNRSNRHFYNYGHYTRLEIDSSLMMKGDVLGKAKWNNTILNAYLEKQIRDNEKLNIDFDYLIYNSHSPTEGSSTFYDQSGNETIPEGSIFSNRQSGIARSPIRVAVLKMDYAKQFSAKIKLEAGIKGTHTTSSALSRILSLVDDEWVGSSRYTNDTKMQENIGAAYLSVNAMINPKTSLVAGLRYEYAYTHADADKEENEINRRLGKLFPSLFLSRKLNERSELQFSYTRRITRPSFNDLSSYLLYNDPMSVMTGNPTLRPTITNNLKFGFNYTGYSFSLTASRDKNPIVLYQLDDTNARDLLYQAPQNMVYQNNLTFQANLPISITKWWNMSFTGIGGLRQFKLDHTRDKMEKTYAAYNFNGNQVFSLSGGVSFELSGWYNSVAYEGSKRIRGFGMLNAGLKKELKNNGGSFQLAVSDIFKSMRVKGNFGGLTREAFDLTANFVYVSESARTRIVKLTYSRSFGNNKVKSQGSRTTSKDESDRIRKN